MSWPIAVKIRKGVQVFFFALFVALLFGGVEQRAAPPLADLFFRLNPLSALSTAIANRAWAPGLEWALLTAALTLLAGRAWCGWICPLGSLLEWITPRDEKKRPGGGGKGEARPRPNHGWKYAGLAAILAAAALGNLTLLAFDPLAILTRAMTAGILPAFHYAVNALEAALYQAAFLRPAVDGIEAALRGVVLPAKPPAFTQNLVLAGLLLGVLALNWLAPRYWCRSLCPLGALLGWLSRIALFRPVVGSACNRCTRCAIVCRPGAVEVRSERAEILSSECTVCLDCLANCKKDDIRFRMTVPAIFNRRRRPAEVRAAAGLGSQAEERGISSSFPSREGEVGSTPAPRAVTLTRREFLASLGAGALGVLLLRSDPRQRRRDPLLIRPPGAQDEAAFLSTCLRCAQCMKICPTSALQPAAFEAGLEGLWTPVLTPRLGYCDYGCTACGQVCPSGAIPELALERKREAVIGKASVNRNRCLPWASGTPCIVCEEMCPTPQKSIRLEEAVVPGPDGQLATVQRPYVLRELCIGCGICENRCPLEGEAGIRVYGI